MNNQMDETKREKLTQVLAKVLVEAMKVANLLLEVSGADVVNFEHESKVAKMTFTYKPSNHEEEQGEEHCFCKETLNTKQKYCCRCGALKDD